MNAYEELTPLFRRIAALQEAAGILHWDMATLMPQGGATARAEQLAALDLTCHEMLTDPRVADLLAAGEAQGASLDPWRRANLGEMRRLWVHASALEPALVEALSKTARQCEMIWREAAAKSEFAMVLPSLERLVALVRQEAAAKAEVLGRSLYDALLDLYEPGGFAQRIDVIFDDLAEFLPGFVDDVRADQGRRPAPLRPEGPFPKAEQEALARRLMETVGFDFTGGRLDVSLHPFCGGVPEDIRVTTRYDEADFLTSLMGVLHETGHALYERGLPADWRLQPVGRARGMAMHESQSLIVEMQACRSPEFVTYLAPIAQAAMGGSGPAWEPDNLVRLYNRVEPGLIRVDADEVTYPAHVIVRYRLEKAVIAGDLEVRDLPAAWNEEMKTLLGIEPPDDRLGCLQDIHWYDGAWGYFPTYTLGAMTAAQLFAAACDEHPDIPPALARGDFGPLMGWLGENVHKHGSSLSGEEILVRATGKPLDAEVFKSHLRRRYLPEG
jgi:carboxypeptidase Taq